MSEQNTQPKRGYGGRYVIGKDGECKLVERTGVEINETPIATPAPKTAITSNKPARDDAPKVNEE